MVIAIAIACRPDLIVLDEPTTALDVTTQARLLDLLTHIKDESGMSALYVSHNLGVLEQICDRVAVMYAGELIEIAPTAELFNRPRHPYTRGLIAAVPQGGGRARRHREAAGALLRRDDLPDGCGFAPRCAYSRPECFTDSQRLDEIEPSHHVACWRVGDIEAGTP